MKLRLKKPIPGQPYKVSRHKKPRVQSMENSRRQVPRSWIGIGRATWKWTLTKRVND
jgi:hypothetical protein